jgi:hypothetical protein
MSQRKGAKRVRTVEHPETPLNREQLMLTSAELQTRLGKKYCDETELLPLLVAHGLIRRVRTIRLHVKPLGGDSFPVTLGAAAPTVAEAKAEIARVQGTPEAQQDLFKEAVKAGGGVVREDDAEAELLENTMELKAGDVLSMLVKDLPFVWRTFPEGHVALSESGAVATHTAHCSWTLLTTGIEVMYGKHYWELELLSENVGDIYVGVCKPGLEPNGDYTWCNQDPANCNGFFKSAMYGSLLGSRIRDSERDDFLGKKGDRIGMLLDLDDGSLIFFVNGVQDGTGYQAGTLSGPLVHAVQLHKRGSQLRLIPDAPMPGVSK